GLTKPTWPRVHGACRWCGRGAAIIARPKQLLGALEFHVNTTSTFELFSPGTSAAARRPRPGPSARIPTHSLQLWTPILCSQAKRSLEQLLSLSRAHCGVNS